jgi:hypothetical protein
MQSRADTLGTMIAEIQKKKNSQLKAMERLKNYMQYIGKSNPQALKGKVYKGHIIERGSVNDNYDKELLPDGFLRAKTTHTLDKKLILDMHRLGKQIPGTVVDIKTSLRIT